MQCYPNFEIDRGELTGDVYDVTLGEREPRGPKSDLMKETDEAGRRDRRRPLCRNFVVWRSFRGLALDRREQRGPMANRAGPTKYEWAPFSVSS